MKISVVGTGYVGLVTGAGFSELGVDVVCVDNNQSKIDQLNQGGCPIHETQLPELLERNSTNGRLTFSTDLKTAVIESKVVMICVNTPSLDHDGSADLTDVLEVTRQIAECIVDSTVVVVKSTVPVGTGQTVRKLIESVNPDADIHVASNPEFLSEGTSLHDFMNPSRIVIGTESAQAKEILRELYLPFILQDVPIVDTNLETAEMIKYASNAFLATKISFINEVADLCELTGVDVRGVAYGIGLDERIGKEHLRAGPGYGGLCFPKDTIALVQTARNAGSPVRIVEQVVEINNQRKINMALRVQSALGGSVHDKVIAILGLAFKPGTDDIRDSPSIAIINKLTELGAIVHAHDPLAIANAQEVLQNVAFFDDVFEAVRGADAVVFATAWDGYRKVDIDKLLADLTGPVIVDLHNLFEAKDFHTKNITYVGVGQGQTNPCS
ncbi:MAG: UDP-glucose/GDP-mannose dehydrogenase family protein [Acidiferrobacterales bacterium]|nr:UDP-glucose/GDP-mannose dehydrogenase family protein [Acidiferrobacterales bacterium]